VCCRWEAAAITKHELEAALSTGKLALSKLKSEPERARKQADSVERAAVALKAEVERLHTRAQESAAELTKMEVCFICILEVCVHVYMHKCS
jgi:uncharacterized coiled-coil DUF342 family protein